MKTSHLLALASAGALAAVIAGGAIARQPAAPAAAAAAPAAKGKPQFGTFGFDEAGMDRSVSPGDDFYAFANGTWSKNTPIPADKSNFGAFEVLQDLSDQRTRGLLEAAGKDPASKIGQAYTTYLDTATIESKGLAPIKPMLAWIESRNTPGEYAAVLALTARAGIGGPFGTGVTSDAKNPDAYTVGLRQSGLGMPDRDYYLSADPKLAAAKEAYQAHVAKMLSLAGEADSEARAAALVAFETGIAKASWTRIESRDADKTYNRMSLADLQKAAPGFDFATYFRANGLPGDSLIVGQPSAITGIAALIGSTPLRVLKDQLIVRALDAYADVLPKAFDAEQFHFYGTVLSGTPQQQERWKRAVQFTSGALTDDVSKVYVARYFPPATKAAADLLVKNIIAAMNVRIEKLDWMAPATKVKAHAKLAAFTPRIGYPSQWRDYATLRIVPGDALGNELRANKWAYDYNRAKLGKPVYRWEWGMTPMTVNAQANPTLVAITFPAAILQPPFFDPNADPAVNYGGIGAVIGHEMSHHFDDQGSKFDLHGKLTQWWTDADVAKFKKLSGDLVAEYDKYEPLPGMHVKGALTLGENSADLAGLSAAYDAYHRSLGGRPAPVIGGMTGDQRFYLGWAQVWRRNYREANLRNRLLTDPHSPSEQRTWIVRNMAPWYAAFGAKPGQKLYLAPADRVRIW
ncbi:M13 family metallopeptidase [Sphingomonas sp. AR_OL41]|uniref:M13 family metallopeptidase n=1 Tax=Sphingomonas sp. AR_OL41 TaxID=3042729 RepID=UPI002480B4DD|nr:M13 family metallopeptidase [Sphingomonas sp. AR_OL41]MDH7974106.1 M13 family metallopeptidase [Sphingomonas sp. AR_OL41]